MANPIVPQPRPTKMVLRSPIRATTRPTSPAWTMAKQTPTVASAPPTSRLRHPYPPPAPDPPPPVPTRPGKHAPALQRLMRQMVEEAEHREPEQLMVRSQEREGADRVGPPPGERRAMARV